MAPEAALGDSFRSFFHSVDSFFSNLAQVQLGALLIALAAFTWRRMPQHTGGKGSYGHRHKEAEEIYFVVEGKLQFKLEDDVIDVEAGNAVLVPPHVVRSVWNDSDEDAVVIIVSNRVDDPRSDAETVPDFWPDE